MLVAIFGQVAQQITSACLRWQKPLPGLMTAPPSPPFETRRWLHLAVASEVGACHDQKLTGEMPTLSDAKSPKFWGAQTFWSKTLPFLSTTGWWILNLSRTVVSTVDFLIIKNILEHRAKGSWLLSFSKCFIWLGAIHPNSSPHLLRLHSDQCDTRPF